jgi:hypothetical protein
MSLLKLAQASLHHFGRNLRLVVVYREEEINGFFEDVVVNRGGQLSNIYRIEDCM